MMRRALFFTALVALPLAGCGSSEQNGVTMLTPGSSPPPVATLFSTAALSGPRSM